MDIHTYTDARANLKTILDKAVESRAPVAIHRQNGGDCVILSMEEWRGMEETLHLMSSPRNAESLMESIRELDAGEGVERDLIQP
ncbi:MAG: type II toxin-antitoxin system prevent-host-death family antitoxin [Pacificimonas sp.]|jgi:antitoxin YefM|nr:type II toxin-antitoxin system prevent-host-death family antitoxin [Pacificimonas sp.]